MQQRKLEVGIIGLGKFGLQLARTLIDLNQTVIGIDNDDGRIAIAQQLLPNVYKADASNITALKALRVHELDYVMVCVGAHMEHSLNITLNLQELHVQHIWVKAMTIEHRKILKRLGVEYTILPEHDAATMAAHQLTTPGILDLIPKYGELAVKEITVNAWQGKTLQELDLIRSREVMVLSLRSPHSQEVRFAPSATTPLEKGDVLLVVGRLKNVQELQP